MKGFTDICRMTQPEVKEYMKKYLKSKFYDVICEDGFLYAKGDVPVLLVAHMDTVHKEKCGEIMQLGGRISSPQGIGGDDRCGIFIIANIVKELHCSVLLCEDEEIGGVGARKFAQTDYIKNLGVNYMIEFDRKGNNDAVFYHCDNQDFINFVLDSTGFKEANGTYSDISTLMEPSKLCAVNLSSGYYNAHTKNEYVVYDEMFDTIAAAKGLIKEECTEPFKYVKKEYKYTPTKTYNTPVQTSMFDKKNIIDRIADDTHLELEVVYIGYGDVEKVAYGMGETKAECWLDVMTQNPWLCLARVVDYSFM